MQYFGYSCIFILVLNSILYEKHCLYLRFICAIGL